jgi:hypothetical protein
VLSKEINPVYPEDYADAINALCGQKAKLQNIKATGAYSYHCI